MSTMAASAGSWDPEDNKIIDIGGTGLNVIHNDQIRSAFAGKGDFPKEVAYTTGMKKWFDIAAISYQTSDELEIIKETAKQVVSQLPSDTKIIDLGAGDSPKYEAYAQEFMAQGKTCTYVALDMDGEALRGQLNRAKAKFPAMRCIGLLGSFKNGYDYFGRIPSARLFLSLGSIFYNAPDAICKARCAEFNRHLGAKDRLIIGQDGVSGAEGTKARSSYNTKEYEMFFSSYLEAIQKHAGIKADAKKAWTVESKMDASKHYFDVKATETLTCHEFGDLKVEKGQTFAMFPAWKRNQSEVHQITQSGGLAITTLGKAKNSGMRQYLIQKP